MSVADAIARTHLGDLLTELTGQPVNSAGTARWRCISPQHLDVHPSTTIFEDKRGVQRFTCWSCGHAGTAVDALVTARSMSVAEAISELETRTNTTSTQRRPTTTLHPPTPEVVPFSDAAVDYLTRCAHQLWTPVGRRARTWLHQRGLNDAVLRDNLVGFDPGPNQLARPDGLPRHVGVTYTSFDPAGVPVYVQCRLLNPQHHKYANPRREHGSIPAVSFPRGTDNSAMLLVTEGVPDGLIAATAGFTAASVAAVTTITSATAAAITTHSRGRRIVLAFDNDPAGCAATVHLRELISGDVAVLRLPPNSDLTDTYNQRNTWAQDTNYAASSTR